VLRYCHLFRDSCCCYSSGGFRDLDGLLYAADVLEKLCSLLELLLVVYHLHILEPYPFALVSRPTHPVQSLKCLHCTREGFSNYQWHYGLLASVVDASHSELILSYDEFEWLLVQGSQQVVVGVVVHNDHRFSCNGIQGLCQQVITKCQHGPIFQLLGDILSLLFS
jgi:hypothetical protein